MDEFKSSNVTYLELLGKSKQSLDEYNKLKSMLDSLAGDINQLKSEVNATIDKRVEDKKNSLLNVDLSKYTTRIESIKEELKTLQKQYKQAVDSVTDTNMLGLLQGEAEEVRKYRNFINGIQIQMEERLGANTLAVINQRADTQGITNLTEEQIKDLKEHADYMQEKLTVQLSGKSMDVYKGVDVVVEGSYRALQTFLPEHADKVYLGAVGVLVLLTLGYPQYAVWIIALPFVLMAGSFFANYTKNKNIVAEYLPLRQLSALADNKQLALEGKLLELKQQQLEDYRVIYESNLKDLTIKLNKAEDDFRKHKESLLTGFDENELRQSIRQELELAIRTLNDSYDNNKKESIALYNESKRLTEEAKGYKAYNEKLKEAIISISQTQKGVGDSPYLSEFFFLGIDDSNNRSMNFDWGSRANIIVYDDTDPTMERTIISINTNIILQMLLYTNPTKFTPYIVDNKEAGMPYTKFLANHELGLNDFFKRVTTTQDSRELIDDLYERQDSVINKLLTHSPDIHSFNRGRYELGSTTEKYSVVFFINYEPSILTDERLKQLILNSYKIGIVPIFYIPKTAVNSMLNMNKEYSKTYGYIFSAIEQGRVYSLQDGKFLRYMVRGEDGEAECISWGVNKAVEEIIKTEKGD